jgi:hypothetical protein
MSETPRDQDTASMPEVQATSGLASTYLDASNVTYIPHIDLAFS